jgi:hypothetical protein
LLLEKENRLKKGKYIFVAKAELLERDHKLLQKDFNFAVKRLGLLI